ncbi:alcohol dehydrogenase catalytic domain-containing protein [Methylobacterium nonmethylotrophicum]|uniref:Zinc-binding alcohol dehydrogenase family protein n=1 Tax=Methylobacterium nonmethylotrophicum TaxID=1141884 RepID=A0A4Z0NRU4_9HYPH|nr:zinc-binding alcohol dehydrogenase family protein [Methylobacterium nonmethylotrophicum]TGD99270.1 zinc-binding alcohol dehydrogenase family protein [Methylobacterium nonmethylotrophicum]
MQAAVLKAFGSPLVVEEVPDPVIGTGEVIVDVVAAPVLSYADEVFSGARRYLLPPPVIPGCGAVGRVRTVGPDATKLRVGDWVFCDPTVRSRDDAVMPDIVLQGWSARGEGGQRLQGYHRHGAFAEQVRVPTENAIRIGALTPEEAAPWCAINTLLVPFGGLLAANLQAGETLLVSGATGHFGSAAIAAGLAMGAGCVVAPGRNAAVLADLARRFGDRVRPVRLTGDAAADRARMMAAAPAPIDCVLDILPPSVDAAVARAAVMSVRPYGRVVLMGGVGMLGGDDLALPYPWIMRNAITVRGQWMYPPEAVIRMVGLVRAGLLRLEEYAVTAFPLAAVNEAVAHAAAQGGPFRLAVLRPGAEAPQPSAVSR